MVTTLLNPTPTPEPRVEPGFSWSADDAAAARAVLSDLTDDPREVIVLTDEEIVALDGLQNQQMAPTPWLDEQRLSREDLGGIALRGLIARKMVALGPVLDPDGNPTGDVDLTSVREIAGALMLRRTAQTLLRAERQSNAGTRWIFCYAHEGLGVLIEDIDPNGLHVFGATTVAGAAEYVRSITNFSDAPGAPLDPVTFTAAEFEALETEPAAFEGAEGATTHAVFHHGDDTMEVAVVYAGGERVGLLVPMPDDSFVASGITDAHLTAMVTSALAGGSLLHP